METPTAIPIIVALLLLFDEDEDVSTGPSAGLVLTVDSDDGKLAVDAVLVVVDEFEELVGMAPTVVKMVGLAETRERLGKYYCVSRKDVYTNRGA